MAVPAKNTKKYKVIKVSPMERPYVIEIDIDDISEIQKEIGGYFEVVEPFEDPVVILCDEDGKIKGKMPNRVLRDERGKVYDILVGDFIIAGLLHDEFVWLTDELIEKYLAYYAEPEFFNRKDGHVYMYKGDKLETIV